MFCLRPLFSAKCVISSVVCDGTAETGPPGGGQEKEMVNLT